LEQDLARVNLTGGVANDRNSSVGCERATADDRVDDLLPPVPSRHVGKLPSERKTMLMVEMAARICSAIPPITPGMGDEYARRGRT